MAGTGVSGRGQACWSGTRTSRHFRRFAKKPNRRWQGCVTCAPCPADFLPECRAACAPTSGATRMRPLPFTPLHSVPTAPSVRRFETRSSALRCGAASLRHWLARGAVARRSRSTCTRAVCSALHCTALRCAALHCAADQRRLRRVAQKLRKRLRSKETAAFDVSEAVRPHFTRAHAMQAPRHLQEGTQA